MNKRFAVMAFLLTTATVVWGIGSTNQLATGVSVTTSNLNVRGSITLNGDNRTTWPAGGGGGGMTAGDTNWVLVTIGGTNLLIRADLLAIINATNSLLVGQIEQARTNAIATNVTAAAAAPAGGYYNVAYQVISL